MKNNRGIGHNPPRSWFSFYAVAKCLNLTRYPMSMQSLNDYLKLAGLNYQRMVAAEFMRAEPLWEYMPNVASLIRYPNDEPIKPIVRSMVRSAFGNGPLVRECKTLKDLNEVFTKKTVQLVIEMGLIHKKLPTIAELREKFPNDCADLMTDEEFDERKKKEDTLKAMGVDPKKVKVDKELLAKRINLQAEATSLDEVFEPTQPAEVIYRPATIGVVEQLDAAMRQAAARNPNVDYTGANATDARNPNATAT